MDTYSQVAIGGTFDRLHKGHKALLQFALSKGKHLVIGLTSDEYVLSQKKVTNSLSFDKRKQELEAFFSSLHALDRVTIVPIDKNEIPESSQKKVDAIIATEDTLKGADQVNQKRKELGYSLLPVILYPLIKRNGKNKVISSTTIRNGEIDREGSEYFQQEFRSHMFVLPKHLRGRFKKPLGPLLTQSEIEEIRKIHDICITVGDVTTSTFLKKGVKPSLSVVDFIVERRKTHNTLQDIGFLGDERVYHLSNPPSHIMPEVFTTVFHVLERLHQRSETTVLQISGEEDLVVLPILLFSPLGVHVYYGQPGEGIVKIVVTEKIKHSTRTLLQQFEKKLFQGDH